MATEKVLAFFPTDQPTKTDLATQPLDLFTRLIPLSIAELKLVHLHCILWNFQSEYIEEFDMVKKKAKGKYSKRLVRKLAHFFNVHICEWNLGKHNDGSWKAIPDEDENRPHPASISKEELDRILDITSDAGSFSTTQNLGHILSQEMRKSYLVDLTQKV